MRSTICCGVIASISPSGIIEIGIGRRDLIADGVSLISCVASTYRTTRSAVSSTSSPETVPFVVVSMLHDS